ncbi:MAG: hypothetical protein ABW080_05560 [Candidatus Thiodiazotropha sp.]
MRKLTSCSCVSILGTPGSMGKRLHFHRHTNRGLSDEQLSFLEAEWMELNPGEARENLQRVIEEIERIGQRNRRVGA